MGVAGRADLGGLCREARALAQCEAGPGTDRWLDSGSEAGTRESLVVAPGSAGTVLGGQERTLVKECDMGTRAGRRLGQPWA